MCWLVNKPDLMAEKREKKKRRFDNPDDLCIRACSRPS